MKYSIRKNIHNNFKIFEINKLAPRAYAIPYSSKKTLENTKLHDERYSSDMTLCLSGDWDFRFYSSFNKIPDDLTTSRVNFDKVTVPSDWQRTGHEEPVYLNCPYQFKTFEPDVPEDMPCGVYRKKFKLDKTADTYIITFLGVANNLSLYVNGTFIGYSEGSHNTAEFDLTKYLRNGENEILCVLFKWCNGSFLEAQDMFRDNGIFRDVLLTGYKGAYIYDFQVNTEKAENGYKLSVDITPGGADEITVKGVLATLNGMVIAKAEGGKTLDFGIVDVKEWNAEIPSTYYIYLTVVDGVNEVMTVRNITGFRTIEIDGPVFRFNGQPIKFLGVNHHDTDLYKGYAMSLEDMERDVQLIKKYNGNAVRTSHYPPDPYFLMLCDVYGLYVVDEADIETHGAYEMSGDTGYLSKQKKWSTHYVDRVKRMYYRDRNRASVTMWSLGNESDGYLCHDDCYKYLKSTGTRIPVHYEGVCRTKRFHYDVISEMYTNTYDIDMMIAGKRGLEIGGRNYPKLAKDYNKFPFFLCEYCHAMGVGPGNLKEYVDRFLAWDGSMGGCIWEWADHTVYHGPDDRKYKYKYTYGGDHGEKQHDGHFCVDALVYSDRTPHTGVKEMAVAYRPIRLVDSCDHNFTFTNINRFRSTEYYETSWELLENGRVIKTGKVELDLAPMQSKTVKIDIAEKDLFADYAINFIYKDTIFDREIAREQCILSFGMPVETKSEKGDFTVKKTADAFTVEFANGEITFGGENVTPVSYIIDGKQYLSAAPEKEGFNFNLARAWIDNDSRSRDKWADAGLEKLVTKLDNSYVNICDDCVSVLNYYYLINGRSKAYYTTAAYKIYADGRLNCCFAIEALSDKTETDLPRFGCTFELAGDFENVEYYGRGPAENMPDFNIHAPLGVYTDKVTDMFEPYVYPQESGMHCDTAYFTLSSEDGKTVTVKGMPRFAFSVHHFTQNDINRAGHQEDLVIKDTSFITVDGYVRGIGSGSCGPDTREEYIDRDLENHAFAFDIIPGGK